MGYPISPGVDLKEQLEWMGKADSMDGLVLSFCRMFGVNTEWKVEAAKARALVVAHDRSKVVATNSVEAAHVVRVLDAMWMKGAADAGLPEWSLENINAVYKKLIVGDRDQQLLQKDVFDQFVGEGDSILPSDFNQGRFASFSHEVDLANRRISDRTQNVRSSFNEERSRIIDSAEYGAALDTFIKKIRAVYDDARAETRASGQDFSLSRAERHKLFLAAKRKCKKAEKLINEEWDEHRNQHFFKELNEDIERAIERETRVPRKRLERYEAKRKEAVAAVGRKVLDGLLEKSPIGEQEAKDWVSSCVHVSAGAVERLKRNKGEYTDIETIKADMCEFYRLIGGKIGAVKIVNDSSSRAFASASRGEISIDSNFNKETLFHEMGHHVEFLDKAVFMAASHFRESRSEGKSPVRLRSLSNRAYKKDEIAAPDSFFSPYVGKIYKQAATEVISMGLQQLASPEHVLDLLTNDRQHLSMVLGIAAHNDPTIKSWIQMNQEVSKDAVKAVGVKDQWDQEMKRVASPKTLDAYLPGKRAVDEYPILVPSYKKWGSYVQYGPEKLKLMETAQEARNFLYLIVGSAQQLFPGGGLTLQEAHSLANGTTRNNEVPYWFDGKLPLLKEKSNG